MSNVQRWSIIIVSAIAVAITATNAGLGEAYMHATSPSPIDLPVWGAMVVSLSRPVLAIGIVEYGSKSLHGFVGMVVLVPFVIWDFITNVIAFGTAYTVTSEAALDRVPMIAEFTFLGMVLLIEIISTFGFAMVWQRMGLLETE